MSAHPNGWWFAREADARVFKIGRGDREYVTVTGTSEEEAIYLARKISNALNDAAPLASAATEPGPWCPKGELYIGQTAEHVVTEDDNGCFRVHHPKTGVCLSLHGTPARAFKAAEAADAMHARSRRAIAAKGSA